MFAQFATLNLVHDKLKDRRWCMHGLIESIDSIPSEL